MSTKTSRTQEQVYRVEQQWMRRLDFVTATGNTDFAAFGSTFVLPKERHFSDLDAVQRYIDDIVADREVRSWLESPLDKIVVAEGRYNDAAFGSRGRILLPATQDFLREMRVLHELAHAIDGSTGHGTAFRNWYGKLIGHQMGEQLAYLFAIDLSQDRE